jgi:hypothetical protein
LLLAHVADIERKLALDLIDAIAVDIALIDDNVTDVDTNAKFDPAIFGSGAVALGHHALYFQGTTGGVNRARKLDQKAVTCSFDDAAAMFAYLRIDELTAASLERCESTFLVIAH